MSQKHQNSEFRRMADYPSRMGIWYLIGDILYLVARRLPLIRRWRDDRSMVLFLVGAFAVVGWMLFWITWGMLHD